MSLERTAEKDAAVLDLGPMLEPESWNQVAEAYADALLEPFGRYADDAIALAELTAGERALDVATGPGTLALRAARTTRVDALDFSPQMLAALHARADAEQRTRLSLHEGDGQALPFADNTFDVAFSLFGLFMFPDRAKGFAEMARVLLDRIESQLRALLGDGPQSIEMPAWLALGRRL